MQIQIIIKNSFSYISYNFSELPQYIQNAIVKELSYNKKSNMDSYEVYLLTKNRRNEGDDKYYIFPTGLLLRLYRKLKSLSDESKRIQINFKDQRGGLIEPRDFEPFLKRLNKVMENFERRDYQINAIKLCLKYKRGLIEHSTSAGKTLILAGLAYSLNTKTLILCIGKEHIFQIQKDLGAMVGGHITVYGGPYKNLEGDIVIATVQSLNSFRKRNENRFKEIMKQFKCVIADEIHILVGEINKTIFYYATNAIYRYGFSGTMYREDGAFMEAEAAIGPILDKKDYSFLEKKNYISKANFYLIDPMCKILLGQENYWPYCLSSGIVNNEKRNLKIVQICEYYRKLKKQILVITPFRVKHGKILEKLIPDSKFVYGESENLERQQALENFRNKEFSVIISSTIFDLVINLPNLNAVILAGGGKSHNSFFQRVGRGIRKASGKNHVDIILFWDSHSSVLLKHSKVLKSYIEKVDTWKDNIKFIGKYRNKYMRWG